MTASPAAQRSAAAHSAPSAADDAPSPLPPLTAGSLVVLVHGMDGCPGELGALACFLREAAPAGAEVFAPDCNLGRTHDGVLPGGERLAAAIRRRVEGGAGRFSDLTLVGMSLGGIYCRVAAGLLFDPSSGTFAGLRPRLLLTIASPHCGVGCWGALGAVPRAAVRAYASLFLGRTERELLLLDGGGGEGAPPDGGSTAAAARPDTSPLLLALADPSSPFHAALAAFPLRVAYANCCNDPLVPFESAALLPDAPPPPIHPTALFGPPRVVWDSARDGDLPPGDAARGGGRRREHPALPLAREVGARLGLLPWRRVGVAVPGVLPAAHCAVVAHRGSALHAALFAHGEPLGRHQAEAVLGRVVEEAAPAAAAAEGVFCAAAVVAPEAAGDTATTGAIAGRTAVAVVDGNAGQEQEPAAAATMG